jgi:hypothetical protein
LKFNSSLELSHGLSNPFEDDWISVLQLLVTADVVPTSPILLTLMMEAIRSFETSVLTRATWRNIPEDGILHVHRSENIKAYIELTG